MKTMCKASKIVSKLQGIENEIDQAMKQLNAEISQLDRELSEFYHVTEVHDRVNAAEGYGRYIKLREILRSRRVIKNEKDRLRSLHHSLTHRNYTSTVDCVAQNVKKLSKKHEEYTQEWDFTYDDFKQGQLQ
jgi:hypothetical protein